MNNIHLENVCLVGLGLLGGSLGLAVNRVFPTARRVGYSHRASTRQRALEAGAVDEVHEDVATAVAGAQLVVLASPIGTFETLFREIAPALPDGCLVTDVGSTKVWPARWARRALPARVTFLGSHPMAGSEQRGVDFARADLFDAANCILTPTARTPAAAVSFLRQFWEALGMRVSTMSPTQHDRVLARISHLPHVLAMALVNCSDPQEMLLCGKGFLDTTRIASGPPSVWRDILMSNAENTARAIDRLVKELTQVQAALRANRADKVTRQLGAAQDKRNQLVERKLKRKELPA